MTLAIAHLTVHQWDKESDGKIVRVKLPKKVKVEIEVDGSDGYDSILNLALDAASDTYGWCIIGATLTRVDFP
jgi:hypothetical protein